jgi:hypothetical protein
VSSLNVARIPPIFSQSSHFPSQYIALTFAEAQLFNQYILSNFPSFPAKMNARYSSQLAFLRNVVLLFLTSAGASPERLTASG